MILDVDTICSYNVLCISQRKKTSKWGFTTRLQLPVVSPDTSSINSISQNSNLSTGNKTSNSIGGRLSNYDKSK